MSTHTSTWTVAGMTCGHCVASVTEEIAEIDGVETVDVTLESGEVVVTSNAPLERVSVERAVSEAGYELTS
ncbi:heavy metal-associated domain-containing protein [Nocardioides cremeus]|jgi:copper ion binding protein|uniref:Heavy metal-associated domain-containing protein n=1 Tax=Nocardioides cremeus TaxID=3058044 RepID=A0ABT8TU53_9ACTN|nr:heavy metal-associated domain-containing protein [Nocardioides cremeus]MDO3396899.1 heavy metal-associated domain-containing protein [Nocardioides cremeus]